MCLGRLFRVGGAVSSMLWLKAAARAKAPAFVAITESRSSSSLQFPVCSLGGKVGTGARKFG